MKSKVFLSRFGKDKPVLKAPELIGELFEKSGFSSLMAEGDLALLKLHFGEKGNKGYIKPPLVKAIADKCKLAGAKPFLGETNTLYVRQRHNAVDHLMLAAEHGFTIENTGCPVIIADGLRGYNTTEVKVNGKHSENVNIAPDAVHADAIIGLAHVTGHIGTGLGAALKNIGMGLSSRAGKLIQHSGEAPSVDKAKCTGCGTCAKWCPEGAIYLNDDCAEIDDARCISCGYCICLCRQEAVKFSWTSDSRYLQERMAEHAAGVARGKEGKLGFINVIMDASQKCDCMGGDTGGRLTDDIGMLASTDPVALDAATAQVIREAAGQDVFLELYPDIDYTWQLKHASELGLGKLDYEITEL